MEKFNNESINLLQLNLELALADLIEGSGYEEYAKGITFGANPGEGILGTYNYMDNTIKIEQALPASIQNIVLLHEFAHLVTHAEYRKEKHIIEKENLAFSEDGNGIVELKQAKLNDLELAHTDTFGNRIGHNSHSYLWASFYKDLLYNAAWNGSINLDELENDYIEYGVVSKDQYLVFDTLGIGFLPDYDSYDAYSVYRNQQEEGDEWD